MSNLTEFNKARVDLALDTALNDPTLKMRLKGFIIDSFLSKYKEELIMMGMMLNPRHADQKTEDEIQHLYQDLVCEQIILFLNNQSGSESPIFKDAFNTFLFGGSNNGDDPS